MAHGSGKLRRQLLRRLLHSRILEAHGSRLKGTPDSCIERQLPQKSMRWKNQTSTNNCVTNWIAITLHQSAHSRIEAGLSAALVQVETLSELISIKRMRIDNCVPYYQRAHLSEVTSGSPAYCDKNSIVRRV